MTMWILVLFLNGGLTTFPMHFYCEARCHDTGRQWESGGSGRGYACLKNTPEMRHACPTLDCRRGR